MSEIKEDLWVYRIEDRTTGVGPYQNWRKNEMRCMLIDVHEDNETHPGPRQEGWSEAVWSMYDARFGFISPEQMVAWFDEFLKPLEEHGYLVRIYNVKDAERYISERQCMFEMDDATLEDEMSISDAVNCCLI